MTLFVLATHLSFALTLFLLSAAMTWVMLRVRILDIPNHRSSHEQPVPNSGGVAIALTVMIGFALVYAVSETRIAERHMIGLGAATVAIIVVSQLDDLGKLRTFKLKLATQILAAMLLLVFGIVIKEVTLPYVGTIYVGWWDSSSLRGKFNHFWQGTLVCPFQDEHVKLDWRESDFHSSLDAFEYVFYFAAR